MAWKLLDAVAVTGAGTSIKIVNGTKHTLQCTWVDGTNVTAIILDLEGSLDGINFFQLGTHTASSAELTANQFMFHVVNKDVRYVRANITTLTDAGTPAVTALYDYDTREIGG